MKWLNRKILLQFVLSILIYSMAHSQEYTWPTDASHAMTSSFAEYRPNRFHAGIDIKTWGQVGYKIFAIRPGYISRIRVSPYGYGRALYLKCDTGETVVYGHMDRFSPEIEEYVLAEQEKRGRFAIQLYPSATQFRYQQGDLIGYTGQTGVGYPHLHFEMRDRSNRPINPFLRGYTVNDNMAPKITKIAITPLDASSMVNGDWRPLIQQPIFKSKNEYEINETIVVNGRIGFSVSAYDQMDGITNRYGTYINRLLIDDNVIFEAKYDRFSYDVNGRANLDRNFRLYIQQHGLFYQLFRDIGNNLDHYPIDHEYYGVVNFLKDPASESVTETVGEQIQTDAMMRPGIKTLESGYHTFRIETADFWGNKSGVTGKVFAGDKNQIGLMISNDHIKRTLSGRINENHTTPLLDYSLFLSKDTGKTWSPIVYIDKTSEPGSDSQATAGAKSPSMTFTIPMMTSYENGYLKAIAVDTFGHSTFPAFATLAPQIPGKKSELNFKMKAEFYDFYVRLEFTSERDLVGIPTVKGWSRAGYTNPLDLIQTSPRTFVGTWPLSENELGPLYFDVTGVDWHGHIYDQKEWLYFKTVAKGQSAQIETADHQCTVTFSPNSLYKEMYVRTDIQVPQQSTYYDIVGNIYEIEPKDVPLKGGATITVKYPESDSLAHKLGLYYRYGKNWFYFSNDINKSNGTISGKLSSLGSYCLIRDEQPPVITSLSPGNGARLTNKKPKLQARFVDKLSGIRGEENMVLRLDGKKLIAEYDPENDILFYQVRQPLSLGRHTISFRAKDRAGNASEREHVFWID